VTLFDWFWIWLLILWTHVFCICHLRSIANMLTCWVPHSFDSFYLWCWFFANPAPAPAGFEFINPAKSGFGRIWKIGIRYIHIDYLPTIGWFTNAVHRSTSSSLSEVLLVVILTGSVWCSIYTVGHKKRATLFGIITSMFRGGFLHFLHQWKREKML